jgi:hypothetical protein
MIKLVESFNMTTDLQKQIRKVEDPALRESLLNHYNGNKLTEGASLTEGVTLWEMPVSRYDTTNANGRIYEKALWERVISEQRHIWEGGLGLADHPSNDSDGNFKEAAVVWLDLKLDENQVVWGTCAFVGNYGTLAEDIIRKGGRVGFSSSGLGDLLEGGRVDPKTYLIERIADIVLNPSQNVFGTASNKRESVSSNTGRQQTESVETNLPDKGNTRMSESVTISKLEEKRFRKDIETFLNDAEKISDPQKKLAEMEDLLSMFNNGAAPELREAVEKKIEGQKAKISSMLSEAGQVEKDFGVENTQKLKEGVSLLAAEVQVAAQEAKDWEKIANVLSESLKKAKAKLATTPSANYAASLADKIQYLQGALKERDKQVSTLKERSHKILSNGASKLTEASEQHDTISTQLEEANAHVTRLEKRNKILSDMVVSRNAAIKEMKAMFNKKIDEVKVEKKAPLVPTAKERLGEILNINEKSDVESYWTDLISRHGSSILPYKERILRCRTMKEAQGVYLKVLPSLNEGADYYASLAVPGGSGIGINERAALQESVGFVKDTSPVLSRFQEQIDVEASDRSWSSKHKK